MDRSERERIARARLVLVLTTHGAAVSRTLEQKISDAGPFNMRVDPHILIPQRNVLVESGRLRKIRRHARDWYTLPEIPEEKVDQRIEEQFEVLKLTLDNQFKNRIGDALEIAVFRALAAAGHPSLGGFRDLTEEITVSRLRKEEPPQIFSGRQLEGNKRFDFLVGPNGIWGGIECKNIREWLYPDRKEVRLLIKKSLELNVPPILIGRRIPFVTRRLLQPTGMLLWETRHQFYPAEFDNIAAQMKDKKSLGFFDIRVTDHPTKQLSDFITRIIPEEISNAVERFNKYKDLLEAFATYEMTYKEFAARVRRRELGQNEDSDEEEEINPNDEIDPARE